MSHRAGHVVIVGGGVTGLAAALVLRHAPDPPAVTVCEAGHVGHGPQRHAPGLVLPELLDPWGRIARGLDAATCEALYRFAQRGPAWLRATLGEAAGPETEVWHVPTSEAEWEDLQATAALYAQWGTPHFVIHKRAPATDGPLDLEAAVLVQAGVLWVSRTALLGTLLTRVRAAGAEVCEATAVTALRDDADGVVAVHAGGEVRGDAAIVACEGAAGQVVPALAGAITPWRGQGARAKGPQLRRPVICNYGHETYVPHDLGSYGLEIEVACLNPAPGPEDCTLEAEPTDRFQSFLQSFCELRIGDPSGVHFTRPWAATTAFTPDGLPLVGPLPGRPHVAVAAGFHARGLSWGVAAGTALAAGLLGDEPGIPAALSPSRLI